MIKRLQELARCTSLNPSLCCVQWTASGGGDHDTEEKNEKGGTGRARDTWVVCSSGDRFISLSPSVPSEQHRSVSLSQLTLTH